MMSRKVSSKEPSAKDTDKDADKVTSRHTGEDTGKATDNDAGENIGKDTAKKQKPAVPNSSPGPCQPPPEDEYGGGDIVSPELPDPTEDDEPLR